MGWRPFRLTLALPSRAPFSSSSSLLSSLVSEATRPTHSSLLCMMRLASAGGASGWCYEEVDATTGRTPLDEIYEHRLQRIQAIFESPLPPMPKDGSVNPDFFVGFAHYEYRLRDQYRAVLAASLDIPVAAVRLSVAWSGRFDVTHFNRVRKVCGVCITSGCDTTTTNPSKMAPVSSSGESQRESSSDKREELQGKIERLVRAINERQSEMLLGVQLVQASKAVPEVGFAAAERDTVLAERINKWLHEHILKPHLVVVLYGDNSHNNTRHHHYHRGWDIDQQRSFIEEKWIKAFSHRRIVPHILSFAHLAQMLQEAVGKGEVEGVGMKQKPKQEDHKVDGVNSNDAPAPPPGADGEEENSVRVKVLGAGESVVQPLLLDDMISWHALLHKAVFRWHTDRAMFPVFFAHGKCAGGVDEMQYLLHNREALDALLLHPNDVAFKKKFMSRFRASHSRLRMAEEMSA